jgi:hypothetical protein
MAAAWLGAFGVVWADDRNDIDDQRHLDFSANATWIRTPGLPR